MALSQTNSSRTICAHMGLQPVILESQTAMNAVDGVTIERRIRISRPDDGRGEEDAGVQEPALLRICGEAGRQVRTGDCGPPCSQAGSRWCNIDSWARSWRRSDKRVHGD